MIQSLIKCLKSFGYAWSGILFVIRNENNMKFHLMAIVIVISSGLYLSFSTNEWIESFLCIGIVLIAEIINTAIEKMVDFVSPNIHPSAKNIKDIAAGSVLTASIIAAIVWILILIPHFKLLTLKL